mmetsp:Transcript_8135/g.19663  ORF Transcript_8135/g.19663 Transcript_8135/m.19663 type:complete len:202 (-) Transcript_8135:624-1229(-)
MPPVRNLPEQGQHESPLSFGLVLAADERTGTRYLADRSAAGPQFLPAHGFHFRELLREGAGIELGTAGCLAWEQIVEQVALGNTASVGQRDRRIQPARALEDCFCAPALALVFVYFLASSWSRPRAQHRSLEVVFIAREEVVEAHLVEQAPVAVPRGGGTDRGRARAQGRAQPIVRYRRGVQVCGPHLELPQHYPMIVLCI